jgi:hypothetical protein
VQELRDALAKQGSQVSQEELNSLLEVGGWLCRCNTLWVQLPHSNCEVL